MSNQNPASEGVITEAGFCFSVRGKALPPRADTQLAEQARNRDHDSSHPCRRQEGKGGLGVNRRRHGDLREMVHALTAEDERRREAARWALAHWTEYQAPRVDRR
jgi:hypothetical protein